MESISTDVWPENVSWSAYHASQHLAAEMWANANPALISLLPLFGDSAHSFAMIKHGMECISKAVHKLNGSQICSELLKCGCIKGCLKNCKCCKYAIEHAAHAYAR